MFKEMKLQAKLLIIGCLMVAVPQFIVVVITLIENVLVLNNTVKETTTLAHSDLDHIVQSTYGLVKSHQDVNEISIKNSLNVARDIVSRSGGFSFGQETSRWEAVNQFTKASTVVELPRMNVGGSWLGQVSNPKVNVQVVDKVRELVSVTCTIFQRMNASGDMLRVATNVVKKDGNRAISTYIPSVGADGKPNPVVTAVMKGETFVGKAFVVDAMYITAYEPIRDATNRIVGMLYVGIPMESVKSLRQSIMNIVVGKTGYVWVIDSQGNYVISKNGERDGENIFNSKDEDGLLFIQEMIKEAKALKPGEIGEHLYPWKNPGEPEARMKVSKIIYFEPWDWVIGVGCAEEELMASVIKIKSATIRSAIMLFFIFIASIGAAVWVWTIIAKQITQPIIQLIDATERMSLGEMDIKIDVSGKDEIGALAQAINRMQTSLKLAMTRMMRKDK
ncbi:MAG: Cache 3/Cache 2 fusion domain-containing protein [Desulfobacteraceae bacterium]|jgi:methyl-accepting chemotaxis protein